jgi:serine/threonine protein kinase
VTSRFGAYTLLERIGHGELAEVWKARLDSAGAVSRLVALKRISAERVGDPAFAQMFLTEARISSHLYHANVAQVFECGEVDGHYFLAMELVEGCDLASAIRAERARGALDAGLAAFVVSQVCAALDYIHALTDEDGRPLQLVHRDVSPTNVMLSSSGTVKLIDFGIAKAIADAQAPRTRTGVVKGNLWYLSPEQVEGHPADHRSDLFACGILLHEALTGRRLFKGATDDESLQRIRAARVSPPSQINPDSTPELDRICLKATARDPRERYQSAVEMARDLQPVVDALGWGSPQLAAKVTALFPPRRAAQVPRPLGPKAAPRGQDRSLAPRPRGLRWVAFGAALAFIALGLMLHATRERNVVRTTRATIAGPPGAVSLAPDAPAASSSAVAPAPKEPTTSPPATSRGPQPARRRAPKVTSAAPPPGADPLLPPEIAHPF